MNQTASTWPLNDQLRPDDVWDYWYSADVWSNPVTNPNRYHRKDGASLDAELTAQLTDASGLPGSRAYEIISFIAQANAMPIGTKSVAWFDTNVDISSSINMGLVDDRASHSYQFYHDAGSTNEFYEMLRQEAQFVSAYPA